MRTQSDQVQLNVLSVYPTGHQEHIIEQTPLDNHSDFRILCKTAWVIILDGLKQTLGDSYGLQLLFLTGLLSRLNNSTENEAAYALTMTLFSADCVPILSLLFPHATLISELLMDFDSASDQQKENIRDQLAIHLRNMLLHNLIFVTPAMLVLSFSGGILKTIFRQNDVVANIAESILRPISWAIPSILMITTLSQFIIGAQKTNIFLFSFSVVAASVIAGRMANPGTFGFSSLPFNQVIIPFIAAPYIISAIFSFYIFRSGSFYSKFHLWKKLKLNLLSDFKSFGQSIRFGLGCVLQVCCEFYTPFFLATMCGALGNDAQAAFTNALQAVWASTSLNIFFGVSNMIIIGNAGHNPLISGKLFRKMTITGLLISFIAGSIVPIIFASHPDFLINILGNADPEVEKGVRKIATPIALFSICDSISFTCMFVPRAKKDFIQPTLRRAMGVIVSLTAAAILAFGAQLGVQGIAFGAALGSFVSMALLVLHYFAGLAKTMREKILANHGAIQTHEPFANTVGSNLVFNP